MLNLQLAKDTFYAALRDRIASGNPARTVVVRGVQRPGLVVAENEFPGATVDGMTPVDAFSMRWSDVSVDTQAALPLIAQSCEIRYATDGSAGLAGLDRGRALAAMDAELASAIAAAPQSASSMTIGEVAGGGAANESVTATHVFWGDVTFKAVVMRGERMERTAEVEVFSYGQ